MNISCVLALTACLHSHGTVISGSDAAEMLDDCQVIARLSADEYDRGYDSAYGAIFSAKGINIPPGDTASQRKQNALKTCERLQRDFDSDRKWVPPASRGFLWWVNIIGIVLEVAGAALVVRTGLRNRQRIQLLQDTWDGESFEQLRDAVAGQAITELRGFLLVGIGLIFQLLGAFNA